MLVGNKSDLDSKYNVLYSDEKSHWRKARGLPRNTASIFMRPLLAQETTSKPSSRTLRVRFYAASKKVKSTSKQNQYDLSYTELWRSSRKEATQVNQREPKQETTEWRAATSAQRRLLLLIYSYRPATRNCITIFHTNYVMQSGSKP